MSYLAKNISVDSGGIVIADPAVLKGDYSEVKGDGKSFRVPKGTYRCSWKVLNSPNKKSTGKGTLKVVSGLIYVVDPSYVTGDFDRPGIKGVVEVDETGGDGSFDVEFTLVRK